MGKGNRILFWRKGGEVLVENRRKSVVFYLCFLCILCLAGCGKGRDIESQREGHIAVRVEEEVLASPEESDPGWGIRSQVLARQFHQGEIILICAERYEDGSDICLYREGREKEVLVEDAPQEYRGLWHSGEGGTYYITAGKEVIILSGEEVCRWETGAQVTDLCELSDGRVILLLEDKGMEIAELDPVTGTVTKWERLKLDEKPNQCISAGEDGLLLMDKDGVWKVWNPKIGEESDGRECVMPFGTTYGPGFQVRDFRVMKDRTVEVLLKDGVLQHLELYAPEQVIVVRTWLGTKWLKRCADQFNTENGEYYILLEEGSSGGMSEADFLDRTAMEIATGKGADIILSDAVYSHVDELARGGAFENLAPYMEASGIQEEDYFPVAFDTWRDGDKVYGVNALVLINGFWIDREVLGEREPNIHTMVDALTEYQGEERIFCQYWSGNMILKYLLVGSENLWGMVDWDKGTCDFNGELFRKILWISKQYASDRTRDIPALTGWIYDLDNLYTYSAAMDALAGEGKVSAGFLFDDGGKTAVKDTSIVMGISSTSLNKEGAWEFIKYMLSEEVQVLFFTDQFVGSGYPTNRNSFERYARMAIEEGAVVRRSDGISYRGGDGRKYKELGEEAYRALYDPTEEKMAVLREQLEDVRPYPMHTAPLVNIIVEEAGAYFSGDKELEDVVGVIENRVQLYLDEHY